MGRGKGSIDLSNVALRNDQKLLSREEFVACVFARDNQTCVVCGEPALDAHHLIERKLWEGENELGGYFLDNGVSLCADCHLKAESTEISVEELRNAAGIRNIILPEQLTTGEYTKWGDAILNDDKRSPGKLFYEPGVQKVLKGAGMLDKYVAYMKHPRIPHLPWSEKMGEDDIRVDTKSFQGKRVVVTEKMDGENTTIYPDGYSHARSVDSGYHSSRTRVRALAETIKNDIPAGWRICGENMTAEHTIPYENIPVLLIHSIWDGQRMLSYEETREWAELIKIPGIEMAPLLYEGEFDEDEIKAVWKEQGAYGKSEGYVLRLADEIEYKDFNRSVAKWVSTKFSIGGAEHWMTHSKENKIIQ